MTKYQVKDSAGEIHEIEATNYDKYHGEYMTFYEEYQPPIGGPSRRVFIAAFFRPISIMVSPK